MKTLKIALGTTYKQKIKYLQEVLKKLDLQAKIIPLAVESGVASQPLSSSETKKGSINRAKAALNEFKKADFGLGIEIGYEKNSSGKYEMLCWVTVFGQKGYQISIQSHQFLMPRFHQQILKENKYLGDHVREYLKEKNNKVEKEIGIILRDRKPFITNALHNALVHYLGKEEF